MVPLGFGKLKYFKFSFVDVREFLILSWWSKLHSFKIFFQFTIPNKGTIFSIKAVFKGTVMQI